MNNRDIFVLLVLFDLYLGSIREAESWWAGGLVLVVYVLVFSRQCSIPAASFFL